jgi:hypothetical protein
MSSLAIQVGDRVATYGVSGSGSLSSGARGVVSSVNGAWLTVQLDGRSAHTFHAKQCRKLQPRAFKRGWLLEGVMGERAPRVIRGPELAPGEHVLVREERAKR